MLLLVWNINSLLPTVRNAVLKHGSWLGFFQHHSLDILCLQESKVIEDKLTKEVCLVDGYQSFWAISREKKGYSGVTTFASADYAPLDCEVDSLGSGEEDIDREGRVVITDHSHFVLVNVYVPNAGDRPARPRLQYKLRFLEALKQKCDALVAQGREVMVVGDFNVAAEPRDVHPSLGAFEDIYGQEELAAMHALMASYPDVWRRLHPDATGVFSVWDEKKSARAFNQGLRIDFVLCTPRLLERVVSCEILSAEALPPKWSDHAGILLELRDLPPLPPHPPCQHWQRLHRRFVDTSQKSILGMFSRKRPAEGGAAAPSESVKAAAAAAAGKAAAAAAEPGAAVGAGAGAAATAAAAEAVSSGGDVEQQQRAGEGGKKGKKARQTEAAGPAASVSTIQPRLRQADAADVDPDSQRARRQSKPPHAQGSNGGKQLKGGKQQAAQQQAPPSSLKESSQRTIGSFFAAKGSPGRKD